MQHVALIAPMFAQGTVHGARNIGGLDPGVRNFIVALTKGGIDREDLLVADMADDPGLTVGLAMGRNPDIQIDNRWRPRKGQILRCGPDHWPLAGLFHRPDRAG